ncbi:hypothetical protein NLI96_g9801 [Meripilus lineatus]|uniref:DUF6532 domain-containing protein n=1 Tax=Meripilus lineatus TaxID=2056292 RepID=A0AAD5YAM7_9APHY|nr:hypothetical protein NLI96_g9801 [Physisporinus lineatus]
MGGDLGEDKSSKGKGKNSKGKGGAGCADAASEDWQKEVSKDSVFRATVMHYYGLLDDPWINNIYTTENLMPEVLQDMINSLYPEREFTVTNECLLAQNVRILLSDWRSYFFKCSDRIVTSVFTDPERNILQAIGEQFKSLDVPAVAALAHDSITNGTALYRHPDPNLELCKGPYQSQYILETYVASFQKKIEGSRLSDVYDSESFPFPFGALELATFAVHLAFSQFETGKYIHARFSKKTNMKLWSGHCTNIQHKLSNKDRSAFLKAVKRYQPRDIPAATPSNAFVTVPSINSRKSDSEESE